MTKILFPFLALLILLNCNHANKSILTSAASKPITTLPNEVWRGVCYAHSWEDGGEKGYGSPESLVSLKHLKKKNVGWVSLTPFGFMSSLKSTEIVGTHKTTHPYVVEGETDARIRAETKSAKELGFKIMLKPHIWVAKGKWRGVIDPKNGKGETDWKAWWKSHSEWILHYAKLAEALKIEALVVGLELHTAVQNNPDALIKLVSEVRKIYSGHLTYSANWNEPVPVKVWNALDSIGVQLYPPLQKGDEENGPKTWQKNFQKTIKYWEDMASLSGKPIILTEIGFRSAMQAASHPNAWPDRNPEEGIDPKLQAQLYHFLLNEIATRPSIRGVFFWKYFTNSQTIEEGPTGFSPLKKPAEEVMSSFFEKENPNN